MVFGCSGGSQSRTLNRQFPMVQSVIQSGMSRSGMWVLWWLTTPYFESQIPNGSKSHTVEDVPQWYLGAMVAQDPYFASQSSNGSKCHKNSYFESQIPNGSKCHCQGCPALVFGCPGGSQSPTLNRRFPMVQSLIQSGMCRSGMWVLWWLTTPYFESQIPNGSKSHTVDDVPQWYLGALVAQKLVL